jgi:hypothetical protein
MMLADSSEPGGNGGKMRLSKNMFVHIAHHDRRPLSRAIHPEIGPSSCSRSSAGNTP